MQCEIERPRFIVKRGWPCANSSPKWRIVWARSLKANDSSRKENGSVRLCQCSCGRKRRVLGASLKAGQSKRCRSCGAQTARAQIRRGYLSVTANGVTTTLAAQCRLLNLNYEKVRSFMRKHGVSAEQAIAHYERRAPQ
jgi:hypothetical protein